MERMGKSDAEQQAGFLRAAVAWCESQGARVPRDRTRGPVCRLALAGAVLPLCAANDTLLSLCAVAAARDEAAAVGWLDPRPRVLATLWRRR